MQRAAAASVALAVALALLPRVLLFIKYALARDPVLDLAASNIYNRDSDGVSCVVFYLKSKLRCTM